RRGGAAGAVGACVLTPASVSRGTGGAQGQSGPTGPGHRDHVERSHHRLCPRRPYAERVTRGLSSFWDELVTAGDDLDRLLELVAHRAAEVVGEAGVPTTLSDDGMLLETRAVHHPDAEVRSFIRSVLAAEPYKVGEGIAGAVAARHEPAVLSGLDVDELAGVVAPHALRFLERYPLRSVAVVPMVAFGDLVGTLGVVRTASTVPYDDEDVMVLEALAERAAVALAEVRRGPRR